MRVDSDFLAFHYTLGSQGFQVLQFLRFIDMPDIIEVGGRLGNGGRANSARRKIALVGIVRSGLNLFDSNILLISGGGGVSDHQRAASAFDPSPRTQVRPPTVQLGSNQK